MTSCLRNENTWECSAAVASAETTVHENKCTCETSFGWAARTVATAAVVAKVKELDITLAAKIRVGLKNIKIRPMGYIRKIIK